MNLAVQEDAKVKAIRLADALAAIRTQLWPILDTEAIGLSGARARVLAADLVAKVSLPHWDSAAVDGFAVRGADLVPGRVNRLKVIGEVAAGHPFGGNVGSGQTVRILTGAPLPRGADVVVIQLPGLVVQRSYVGVPSRVLDIMGDGGPSEGIEPVVLREGALSDAIQTN